MLNMLIIDKLKVSVWVIHLKFQDNCHDCSTKTGINEEMTNFHLFASAAPVNYEILMEINSESQHKKSQ